MKKPYRNLCHTSQPFPQAGIRSHSLTPSPAAVLVDRLLPDDVVRAGDGELAAEPDLRRGDLLVADHAVHHDVVRAARLVQRHRRLAVVELAGEKMGKGVE